MERACPAGGRSKEPPEPASDRKCARCGVRAHPGPLTHQLQPAGGPHLGSPSPGDFPRASAPGCRWEGVGGGGGAGAGHSLDHGRVCVPPGVCSAGEAVPGQTRLPMSTEARGLQPPAAQGLWVQAVGLRRPVLTVISGRQGTVIPEAVFASSRWCQAFLPLTQCKWGPLTLSTQRGPVREPRASLAHCSPGTSWWGG